MKETNELLKMRQSVLAVKDLANRAGQGISMSPEEAVEALGFTMQDTKDESQLIGMVFDAAWREYLDECE